MGDQPDAKEVTKEDDVYMKRINKLREGDRENKKPKKMNALQRWYKEEWVNLCEKGDCTGGYAVCGTGKGTDNPEDYPYCRAYYKLPGTTITAQELTKEEIKDMCRKKIRTGNSEETNKNNPHLKKQEKE